MLGWRDRPSKLSNGDYVFVYNTETDSIETCFEIKSLSTTQDPIWQEEIDSPSSNPVYAYRWNAIVKTDGLGITNDIIFGFEPFKNDKKNFSMLIRNKYPRSLSGAQYDQFRNFLLDKISVSGGDVTSGWSFNIEKAIDEILLPDTDKELAIERQ